jgi:hypothetical protein
MLTGQPAFGGEDVPLTLARVLSHDTDFESLPAAISPAVRQTLRLCLQKDPKRRVADIRDVRLALTGAFETEPAAGDETAAGVPSSSPRILQAVAITAVVVAVIAAGLAVWAPWLDTPDSPATRFSVLSPLGLSLGDELALSPDGRYLAISSMAESGDTQIWLWQLDSLDAEPLPGTRGAERMFWGRPIAASSASAPRAP